MVLGQPLTNDVFVSENVLVVCAGSSTGKSVVGKASRLTLEFGHFLVRVPSARRVNRKQPRGCSPGNGTHKEIALKGRPKWH
jgi:hypothetical protein